MARHYNVRDAGEGYQLFSGENLRMGFWGEEPREGEELAGSVSVRQSDPSIPFFCRAGSGDAQDLDALNGRR